MPRVRGSDEQQEEEAEREMEALGDLGTSLTACPVAAGPLPARPLSTRPLTPLPSPPRGGEGEWGAAQALTVGQVLSIQV